MIDRKFYIAGNWKMNGMFDSISEVCKIDQHSKELNSDLALCLPNTIINKAYENISNGKLIIGAQNCHHEESGAFTGEISIAPKFGITFLITLSSGSINLNKKSITIEIILLLVLIILNEINMLKIT